MQPTGPLQTRYKEKKKAMEKEARAGRKESRYVDFQDDEDQQAQDSFLRRVLSSANTPGATEALAHLEAEERQTVANMERAQEAAERQRQARAAELNRMGVFGKNVNAVRAGSMYRVELRRKMQPVALRRKPVEVEETPLSLEVSLQALIDDLDVASGAKPVAVSPQRREQRKQRAKSIYQQIGEIMGKSEPSAQSDKKKKVAGAPKESPWDAQAASAVQRYRSAVQQRREQLVRDSGLSMSGAELLADDTDVDYDAITQRSDEQEEGDESERAEQAKAAATTVGDVGDFHRKPDPQATAALVDTALSRVQRVMQRIEMEQAASSPHKSPTRSGGGDGEQGEASDSESGSDDSDDGHERSRSRTKQLSAVMGEVRAAQDSTRAAVAGTGTSSASALTGQAATSASASSRPAPLHEAESLGSDDAAVGTPAAASNSTVRGTPQSTAAAAAATTTTTRKARKTVFEQAAEPTFWGMAPTLPELVMDEAMSLAERLQKRLERVWGMLRLPVMQKLDMVIKYTSPEMAPRLEAALVVWELAAASVMEREQSLTILEELNAYRMEGKDLPGLDQEEANALTALEVATVYALKADTQLREDFQDTLTLQGVPYMENNTEPGWWHGGLPLPVAWEYED